MNAKANIPKFNNRGRGRGCNATYKTIPIQRTSMGPPRRPAPKSCASANPSSSVNWRTGQSTTINISKTVQTSSSTRSRSSSEPESRIVIALSEGRGEAMCEVGIATINLAHPTLILCQISDTPSYINTLTKINILNPSEILVPLTFVGSSLNRLVEKIKENFSNVEITGVTRSTFNKNNGLQYVKKVCASSMNSVLLVLEHKYYALSAAAALFTYIELRLFLFYAEESIKVEYQEGDGFTVIDVSTADSLELVACARPSIKRRYSCLLDILNHCCTKIGTRVLRASILQPSCKVAEIESRLNCVTELMGNTDMLASVQVILTKITNIDQLLSLARVLPNQTELCSDRQLNYILILNVLLEQIMPLRDIFENSKQPFFIELRGTLSNPAFEDIKELVRSLIHTDAHPSNGHYGIIQRCFAIKSGVCSLLDVLRKSYSERLDDIREYVRRLGEKYNLSLSLDNNSKKNYHIVLALNTRQKKLMKRSDLPEEFIQVERLPTRFTMKTEELINLSTVVDDFMVEILKMSNVMIQKLLRYIRERIEIFYKLCEDIAKLDMLQSLAQAGNSMEYVRPQFSNYLEVIEARHPLLNFLCKETPIANSMYASEDYNMNIITGPNGSGKSIFIRQVVLIQVMAQVGCYVPAKSATFRVADRILARVHLGDNMKCGASTFVLEIKEIQYFLNVLTKNTLIIIDEFGRSTSLQEGTAIAMAVCERLLKTSAFVFFTTHFKLLAKLWKLYMNIKTWQLETLTEIVNEDTILHFTYKLLPGVTSLEHYGIFHAKAAWPSDAIEYAKDILSQLSKTKKTPPPRMKEIPPEMILKYDLEADLKQLKAKRQLTRAAVNEKLLKYQEDILKLGYQVGIPLIDDHPNNSINQANHDYNPINNDDEQEAFRNILYTNLQEEHPQYIRNSPDRPENSNIFPDFLGHNNGNLFPLQTDENFNMSLLSQDYNVALSQRLERMAASNMNHTEINPFEPEIFLTTFTEELPLRDRSRNSFNLHTNPFRSFENQVQSSFLQEKFPFSPICENSAEYDTSFLFPVKQNTQQTWAPILQPHNNSQSVSFIQNNIKPPTPTRINWDKKSEDNADKSKTNSSSLKWMDPFQSDAHQAPPLLPQDFPRPLTHNNNHSKVKILSNICLNDLSSVDASFSLTEQQFARPLQQNIERTSTPLISQPDPIPFTQNRPKLSTIEPSTQITPNWTKRTDNNSNQSKTTSSTKWTNPFQSEIQQKGEKQARSNIGSRNSNSGNSCWSFNIGTERNNQNEAIPPQEQPILSNEDTNKSSSNTVPWNIDKKPKKDNDKSIDLEVSQILSDIQNCSEQIFQEWDYSDEEMSLNTFRTKDEQLESNKSIEMIEGAPPQDESFSRPDTPEKSLNSDNEHSLPDNKLLSRSSETLVLHEKKESPPEDVDNKLDNEINDLEPLGDVHLELFSNESDKTENEVREEENDVKMSVASSEEINSELERSEKAMISTKRKHLGCKTARKIFKEHLSASGLKLDSNLSTNAEDTNSSTLTSAEAIVKKVRKFKPPYKLTKKEIEEEFHEQDQKILESGDIEQYIAQKQNRPTIKQLQNLEVIASIQMTKSGTVVLPPNKKKPKIRKRKFKTPLKSVSSNWDVTIFSDKNVNRFEEIMGYSGSSNTGNSKMWQEMAQFQYMESEVVTREGAQSPEKNVEALKEHISSPHQEEPSTSTVLLGNLKEQRNNTDIAPKVNYYSQHKDEIDKIVDKYLISNTESQTSKFEDSSIFGQETYYLDSS